jgi:hypothetical protein
MLGLPYSVFKERLAGSVIREQWINQPSNGGLIADRSTAPCAASSPGGAERDRTADPLLAKQVLSQLSYSPENLSKRFSPIYD